MKVFLVRHAHAGARAADGRDLYRPLTRKGRDRARDLAHVLLPEGPTRVLSSPATRCVQTVEPLAAAASVVVDEQPDLWEGSSPAHVLALVGHLPDEVVVACSHGDVIPSVIDHLAHQGAEVRGRGCEKGSIWRLDRHDGRWAAARYLGVAVADVGDA